MKVKQLIQVLSQLNPNLEVVIVRTLDGEEMYYNTPYEADKNYQPKSSLKPKMVVIEVD